MAEPRDYDSLDPAAKLGEDRWAEEQAWPTFKVILTGPDATYVARPGVNLDDSGTPQPWVAPRRTTVFVQAVSKKVAGERAMSENPECDNIDSVEKVSDGVS